MYYYKTHNDRFFMAQINCALSQLFFFTKDLLNTEKCNKQESKARILSDTTCTDILNSQDS